MRATTTSPTRPQFSSAATDTSLLTRQDFARAVSTCLRTVDDAIASGDIEIVRIGRSVGIRPSALDEFIEARTTRCNPRITSKKKTSKVEGAQ